MTAGQAAWHPLEGAAPCAQPEAAAYDRRWFVADEDGVWIDASRVPPLATINVEMTEGYLVLRASGMPRLDIPLDVIEDDDSVRFTVRIGERDVDVVDEGEMATAWLSHLLGRTCGLMKVHPDALPVEWPVSD